MRRGFKTDIIILSIILSVVAHIGLMLYAKPRVMTRALEGARHSSRRGPMQVTEEAAKIDPVKIETLNDVEPDKAAPEADETVTIKPTLEAFLPKAADEALSIPEIKAPIVQEAIVPIDELPEVMSAPLSPNHLPDLKMETAVAAPIKVDEALKTPVLADDFAFAPSIDAPGFAGLGGEGPSDDIKPTDLLPKNDKIDKPAFAPTDEVMSSVDEKIVEAEKEAVRDLVDAVDAADLSQAVNMKIEHAVAADGIYFRVVITPNDTLKATPKDVVILLDASGSIGKDRMSSIRNAAKRILRSVSNTGDRFNLVAFRDRFQYAFRTWQPCSVRTFNAADQWLGNVAPYGRTDVFSTISSVLTLPRDPTRPLIALVVTDGDANTGVSATSAILSKFSKLNDGLVSVYMYGVKESANRELIDVLTHGNRGESFIYDGAAWRAGSEIQSLTNRFRDPVLTDLRLVFSSTTQAEAYPRLLKNLYLGDSVEIIGKVPLGTREVAFSLKGLNGASAYESFFRLSLVGAAYNPDLAKMWRSSNEIDLKIR